MTTSEILTLVSVVLLALIQVVSIAWRIPTLLAKLKEGFQEDLRPMREWMIRAEERQAAADRARLEADARLVEVKQEMERKCTELRRELLDHVERSDAGKRAEHDAVALKLDKLAAELRRTDDVAKSIIFSCPECPARGVVTGRDAP